MPCRSYEDTFGPALPSERQIKSYKVRAVLLELETGEMHTGLFNCTNPHGWTEQYRANDDKRDLDLLTRKACEELTELTEAQLGYLSLETQMWFRDHKIEDEKRRKDDAEKKRRDQVHKEARQKALDTFSVEELGLLGLYDLKRYKENRENKDEVWSK